MRFFSENPALSLFLTHHPLTSCKKSEKTNEPILRSCVTDARTDGQTDGPEFIGPFRKAGVQKELGMAKTLIQCYQFVFKPFI